MPTISGMAARKKTTKRAAEPASRGLTASQTGSGTAPARISELQRAIESDGGQVLAAYKDPLGGQWQLLAALPIDAVKPTPYQRDLSESHVKSLADRIGRLDRFLDPVIAYRKGAKDYWVPNGHHRTAAMRALGARAITALVMPDSDIAYKILALNTEKAHNVREKSLEVIRMARALAELDPRPEKEFAIEFEEPTFLTLGLCYEQRGRFSGGTYQPALKRADSFLSRKLPDALAHRAEWAKTLLELDDAVAEAVKVLKERGFDSPYLKAFVVARINPLRFRRGASMPMEELLERMLGAARRFDPAKVKADQIGRAGGPPED